MYKEYCNRIDKKGRFWFTIQIDSKTWALIPTIYFSWSYGKSFWLRFLCFKIMISETDLPF